MKRLEHIKFTPAAVIVPIFKFQGQWHVLFTKRSSHVTHHKGQICFPGGVKEDHDQLLWHTALRETHEEIGISPQKINKLHELDHHITPTKFKIKPFIVTLNDINELNPNPEEIDRIIIVPLNHLQNSSNIRFEERIFFNQKFNVPFFHYQEEIIWGVTGRILYASLEFVKNTIHQLTISNRYKDTTDLKL